jgi:hypothetical protein
VHRVDVLGQDGLGERANTEWFSALDIARKIIEKSNASAFPYQSKKQHRERTTRLQIRYARNQLFEKKRSVAEATMYECYGIGPRRCILGP